MSDVDPSPPASLLSRLPGIVARSTRPRATLGLCLLVGDDAPLLPRCLEAARPFIHSWTIVDTGAAPGTPEIVTELLDDLPGQLHDRPWRDFGTNRTELVQLAAGSADYLLLLDADQIVTGTPVPSLTADAYLVRQVDGSESWVPRLIRDGLPWRFAGSTHDELVCDVQYETKRLAELVVQAPSGRPSRRDLERDLEWLEHDLRESPEDDRTSFYLAQTYRDLGRLPDALELYARCAEEDACEERAFYAAVQVGALTARSDPEAAVPLLLAAWGRRPTRVEPLFHLARAARAAGQAPTAMMAASTGVHLPVPHERMFVHRWMHVWGMYLELAVALAGLGFHREAMQIVDDVLDNWTMDDAIEVDVLCTRQLLADERARAGEMNALAPEQLSALPRGSLPLLADVIGSTMAIQLGVPDGGPSRPGNPSIGIGPQGFAVALQAVEGRLGDDGRFELAAEAPDASFRTFLQVHDSDGAPESLVELEGPDLPPVSARVLGLEDARMVWWRSAWHLVAQSSELVEDAIERTVLVRVDGDRLVDLAVLSAEAVGRPERDWMPFVVGDRLRFVSSCAPFVVQEWDPDAELLHEVARWPARPELADLRGASQGVAVDDGHLFVVHQVHSSPTRCLHTHRVLRTDADHRPVSLSRRFALGRYGIERCAGLAPWGDDLLLTYGTKDAGAWLMSVLAEDVLGLLLPLPPLGDLADPG